MSRRVGLCLFVAAAIVGSACSGSDKSGTASSGQSAISLNVDFNKREGSISPLIRGLSGEADSAYIKDVGITLGSWGGNPATRYNYKIGNAWNAARDWEYRNTDYGNVGDRARAFVTESARDRVTTRMVVPTLGWVARDANSQHCSFPMPSGGCGDGAGATCDKKGPIADPRATSVESTPESVAAWIKQLVVDERLPLKFIAFDNEPELWGVTHYDVHPECPTFQELLDKYLTYADALRGIAPDSQFMGPVICCWYTYWRTDNKSPDGDKDFLSWFLSKVSAHDAKSGVRSLDVLDVHYYPQSDVYNDKVDEKTSARRLRSTRSLYDPTYFDESWIEDRIEFIPRMKRIIASSYPGTALAITEWNFGADATMNGGLAIADVLGIFGREGVYAAAYWRNPPKNSPGYYAFKMHGNYDSSGSSFEGQPLRLGGLERHVDQVSAFAAADDASSTVKVMLLNKQLGQAQPIDITLTGYSASPSARLFTYSEADLSRIVETEVATQGNKVQLVLPPYSISLIELKANR